MSTMANSIYDAPMMLQLKPLKIKTDKSSQTDAKTATINVDATSNIQTQPRKHTRARSHDMIASTSHKLNGPYGTREVTLVGSDASFVPASTSNAALDTATDIFALPVMMEHAIQQASIALNVSEYDSVYFTQFEYSELIPALTHLATCSRISAFDSRFNSKNGVVFIGPFEPKEVEEAWRAANMEVIMISEDENGRVDLEELELQLQNCVESDCYPVIGSFTTMSAISGITLQVDGAAALMRKYDGFSFFNMSGAGPYVPFTLTKKDAVFVSVPGAPASLLATRGFVPNDLIDAGAVEPQAIVETGAAIECFSDISYNPKHLDHITCLLERLINGLISIPNLYMVGSDKPAFFDYTTRSTEIPFIIHAPSFNENYEYFLLHHKYVQTLFADLFGIILNDSTTKAMYNGSLDFHQVSDILSEITGCNDWSWDEIQAALAHPEANQQCNKAGWGSIGVSSTMTVDDVDFILKAVEMIAEQGWKLLPQYKLDVATGEWLHKNAPSRVASQVQTPSPSSSPSSSSSVGTELLPAKKKKKFGTVIKNIFSSSKSSPKSTSLQSAKQTRNNSEQFCYTRQEALVDVRDGVFVGAELYIEERWNGEEFENNSPELSNQTKMLRWWLLPSEVAHGLLQR